MELETVGARLTAFRQAKGLTKYRLAKLSGVSQTYIYRIEKGEIKNPRRDTLQKLAQGLNVTLAQLLGDITPSETWSLVEQSLKAYIPVFSGVDEMVPVDFVACTRAKVPMNNVRGYRIEGLSLEPHILEGDIVIVDSSLSPIGGDLALVTTINAPSEIGIAQYSDDCTCLIDGEGQHSLEDMNVRGIITECIHQFRKM